MAKLRILNRWSGIIGSFARDSTHTNSARNAIPMSSNPQTPTAPQLPFSALVRPMRIGTMPAANVSTPA